VPELGTIRPRSRDLERNNGYGYGANQTYRDNIVGHQLRLNANPDALLLGWKHEEAKEWQLFTNAHFATRAQRRGGRTTRSMSRADGCLAGRAY
jgi:hypothetical protein